MLYPTILKRGPREKVTENKIVYFKCILMRNVSYKWGEAKYHSIILSILFKQYVLAKYTIGGLTKNTLNKIYRIIFFRAVLCR
jgi:hypothetical protein